MYGNDLGHNGFPTQQSRRKWEVAVVLALYFTFVPLLWGQARRGGFRTEPWMDDKPRSTGPAIGEKIPFFRAPDQYGRMQDFDSVRGPKGAVVVFNRSADW